jgi:archaeosine-15-forming tRNA-guanine transglycosylase
MISKEELDTLAMRVWSESESECDVRTGREVITSFAHALIKAVEAESEVVAFKAYSGTLAYTENALSPSQRTLPVAKLIALPLAEEIK